MGHSNSKPRKKGIEKERSRSRSFIKPRKKENSINKNINNINNNNGDENNNNNDNSPTSTPSTTATTITATTSSSPTTPSTPRKQTINKENNDNKENQESKEKKEDKQEDISSQGSHPPSLNPLRQSTIFDESAPIEIVDEEPENNICPICEEETLSMYSLELCGHSVCIPCLFAYTEHKLKNLSKDTHEVQCPVPRCTCIISANDLKAALETFGAGRNKEGVDGDGTDADNNIINNDQLKLELDNEEAGESSSSSKPSHFTTFKASVAPSLPIQLTQSLEQLLSKGNYVHCPNPECKFVFERLPPASRKKSEVVLDEAGNPISVEASKHRDEHRFRCRVCGTNFCAACKSVPYHLGFTCKQKIAAMRAKHCRFCDVALPGNTKPVQIKVSSPLLERRKKEKPMRRSFLLTMKWKGKERSKTDLTAPPSPVMEEENPKEFYVCKSKECTTKMATACNRFLGCNHVCSGTNDCSDCFCLKEECCGEGKQNSDEFCNICWTESLGSGPCIKLECSHVFHKACILSKLERQWPGPAISFAFMNCPLCTQVIQHITLEPIVSVFKALFDQVKARSVQRLEFEGMMNDPRITEVDSEFYGKPAEYAMNIFSFYMCHICKSPYFGGRRQCEVAQVEGAEAAAFNPQELLCGGCSTLNAKCTKHGKEYIEYKCRFCCSLATFYCGGKAHFCTACHDKAGQLVEFINWTTTAKCEPCKGPGLCPLGVQHKENGEEYSLGCSVCRLGMNSASPVLLL